MVWQGFKLVLHGVFLFAFTLTKQKNYLNPSNLVQGTKTKDEGGMGGKSSINLQSLRKFYGLLKNLL